MLSRDHVPGWTSDLDGGFGPSAGRVGIESPMLRRKRILSQEKLERRGRRQGLIRLLPHANLQERCKEEDDARIVAVTVAWRWSLV
jgi:hypothetical protein